MKHVIIGTAGHVDHGKTTLIKALTGTDTDRLKEEQERGMTIDLGFAHMVLPEGTVAGIVDVPGHERFLKNMLAGAGGVDVALMVIAADESVMPQTVEHLDILRLLDVRNGVVALTKADTVDRDWLPVVEEDVRSRLKGTFLEGAPIVRVDAVRGAGIPELRRALLSAVSRAAQRSVSLPFRLPVDRVFTRPGFGTVATGTLVVGALRVGDTVEVLPQGIKARVRGLQTHGRKVQDVEAGMRVAVNLAGVEPDALARGTLLAAPGSVTPTPVLDAVLQMLPSAPRPLAERARVRLYLGTAEVLGRVRVLGAESIAPGDRGYVQFRAEASLACVRGDRFVVRTYSPMATVGGGIVLDTAPPRHRRGSPAVLEALQARERGTPEDLLSAWLQGLAWGGARRDGARATGLGDDEAAAALDRLVEAGEALALDGDRIIHRAALAAATDRALSALEAFHAANPLRSAAPREELRGALGRGIDSRAFGALVARWQRTGQVEADATSVRLPGRGPRLTDRQQSLLDRMVRAWLEAGFNAPSVDEAARLVSAAPEAVAAMLRVGQDLGLFVRIAEGLHYHAETAERARALVREFIEANGSIDVRQFRDLTGSSRRYALPVLEYLDAEGFTRRVGDARVLAG